MNLKIWKMTALLGLFPFSGVLMAQGDAQPDQVNVSSEDSEYADIKANKRPLAEKDLQKKKEGGYITGLPLLNSDPDNGVGYGARVYYYHNGSRDSKLFSYTPYYHKLYLQYFATTNGFQYHTLNYDAPYFMGSRFRVRSDLTYEKNINANYFGIGTSSLSAFHLPADPIAEVTYKTMDTEIRKIDSSGNTNSKRFKYEYENPQWNLSLERDLAYVFHGVIRPILGIKASKYSISDYTGKKVSVDGTDAVMKTTLLSSDQAAGKVTGFDGGYDNTYRFGIAFDSRDYEPDPNNGAFVEMMAEGADKKAGSDFSYTRYTFTPKIYYSPIADLSDLVLAFRGTYSLYSGTVPFFAAGQLSYMEGNKFGLGGLRTLRGYRERRFVGNVMTMVNFEIRWTMFDVNLAGQNFAFILVPFVDAGRVFDKPEESSLESWKQNYGAGLRIAWNQATVIMVDYAMSKEDSLMFINFNHIF